MGSALTSDNNSKTKNSIERHLCEALRDIPVSSLKEKQDELKYLQRPWVSMNTIDIQNSVLGGPKVEALFETILNIYKICHLSWQ